MANSGPSIIVIGAGIIGACTAFYLARKGARVTLIDSGEENASIASFGWINAHSPQHRYYFQMRMKSIGYWRDLSRSYPQLPISFGGGLDWDFEPGMLQSEFELYQDIGYDCELVSGEKLTELTPDITHLPKQAIHCKSEGVVDPELIGNAFVTLAKEHSAQFLSNTKVEIIRNAGDRIVGVQTSQEKIDCDVLVVCAGVGSAGLLDLIGIDLPMKNSYGVLMRTSALDVGSDMVFSTPGLHLRQLQNGGLLVGGDQAGGDIDNDNECASQMLLEKLKHLLARAKDLHVESSICGLRPIPSDNKPIIGLMNGFDNLYVAVMHSGITMAPLVGDSLAKQIVGGESDIELEPFSIKRFDEINAQVSHAMAGN